MPEPQILVAVAAQFTDISEFLQACKEAWRETHQVRRGRKNDKDLLFAAIESAFLAWKNKIPKPNTLPTKGSVHKKVKHTVNDTLSDSTIRKYVKLYFLKMRPANSFTIQEKRWLKKNDALAWELHEEVVSTLRAMREAWRTVSRKSRLPTVSPNGDCKEPDRSSITGSDGWRL